MVGNFEFRDYHRFLVSLGLALIALAGLLPWLFLREPFDLLVQITTLGELTPSARALIHYRQELVGAFTSLLPWISGACLVSGIWLLIRGLVVWKRRQKVHDTEEDLRLAQLSAAFPPLSPTEAAQKAVVEAASANEELDYPPAANQLSADHISRYFAVEEKVARLIERCLGSNYVVLRERRLGPASVDIVIQHRSGNGPDLIIEIKVIRKGFKFGWLSEVFGRVRLLNSLYHASTKNRVSSVILIVAPLEVIQRPQYQAYVLDLYGGAEPGDVRIVFVEEHGFDRAGCEDVRQWTGLDSPNQGRHGA